MVEYNTLKSEEVKYGNNNFIEVARKEIDGNEFISISKGYFLPDGNKRYKGGIGFPDEGDTTLSIAKAIENMHSDAPAAKPVAKEESAEEPAEE
jgi:hypothetical protein